MYADWREALARELLQNSIDAGARTIAVRFTQDDAGAYMTFADDGCGMRRDTLETVFFALGNTTKRGSDTIGGFGRARIITCFAQRGYRISTGTIRVRGSGGEYAIEDDQPHVDGCRFDINLVDADSRHVRAALVRVLQASAIAATVTIDGEPVPTTHQEGRARRILRDTSGAAFAKIYVERDRVGELIVRVNGLKMFSRYIAGHDDVIVEIDPRRSRTVLSAGRDRLAAAYAEPLDAFIDSLARDRRSALTPDDRHRLIHLRSGGFFTTGVADMLSDVSCTDTCDAASDQLSPSADRTESRVHRATELRAADTPVMERSTPAAIGASTRAVGFDFFLLADGTDPAQASLLRAWDPRRWSRTPTRRAALLLAWVGCIEYGIELLVARALITGPVRWTVGILASSEAVAVCRSDATGHVFAVNPQPHAGRYVLGRAADRRRLFAAALHEVAHLCGDGHDERFAGVLTELYGAADPREADRRMRARMQRPLHDQLVEQT